MDTITVRRFKVPGSCANIACPNTPEDGQFELVELNNTVATTKPHTPIRLWMCTNCAHNLWNIVFDAHRLIPAKVTEEEEDEVEERPRKSRPR